jgi:hypothetical protein
MEDPKSQTPVGDNVDLNDEPAHRAPGPSEEQYRRPEPLQAPGEDEKRDENEPVEPQKKIA